MASRRRVVPPPPVPPRAPRGSTPVRHLLALPEHLHAMASTAAEAEGVNLSEWIRRAMQERLKRD